MKGNEILEASLESQKKALHERRLALENDVCFILVDHLSILPWHLCFSLV